MNTKETAETRTEKTDVALREEAMLQFWEEHDIFNKSLEIPAGSKPVGDFVFYDGPPFATGLPHYGHILAGTIKDAIPRFWTMNGYQVRRKWGWDCHGLPLENLIEKKLGLATKRDIEEYGVQNFNEAARGAVMEYADDWRKIIPRMGRWADMKDDYKTMDPTYTESVWWVFSELNKKGLVYEGFKTMHLCPRCGTTLSNFEVNQGYKDIKDIAVTVKLPLVDESDTALLVWTTTPWTLPGNMAAAVHNEHEYVKASVETDEGTEKVILAKARLAQLGTDAFEILEEMKGTDLVGKSYLPPFDYWQKQEFEGKENAWKIYHADYVELGEEGTGAVHLAPAYGDDDMKLAQEYNVPIAHHVDEAGHFKEFVTDFAGQLVKPKDDDDAGVLHLDADIEIVKALKANGRLFKKENITHSYPHCWRCDTPLLNYATTSWFVEVTKIKDQLVAENNKVTWVPGHVGKNRFGKWLEGARDWAVSRQRYWGAPLPIWRNPETKEYKVLGSLAELQEFVPKSGNAYTIMRHGEAESNLTSSISSLVTQNDPLTEVGKKQITTAAVELKNKKIDLIITSPFARTQETAALLAESLGLSEEQVITDDRMRELEAGEALQGKHWREYHTLYQSEKGWLYEKTHNDGAENRKDVQIRTGEFLYEIEEKYKDKNILILGHASSLYALQCVGSGLSSTEGAIDESYYIKNAEIAELSFVKMPHNDNYELDYHRPYIDEVVLMDGDTQLIRVPDVFDCWFESGSMPYAETHYPFENLDIADPSKGMRFPADFISESVDQTRGWFYSMMVLGVALFGKSPYNNVITNGLVLAEDGKKMSKSLQNYPDPMELADRTGVDAIRFYLLSSSIIRGEDLNFLEKEVQELQRKNIGRLHNVLAMYNMFAVDGVESLSDSTHVLDRWIIARLNAVVNEITAGFKNYELDKATRPVTDFIDDLSVWYLRRSRDRLKGEDAADAACAIGTLRHVLVTLAKVIAPSMPFYAEHLWQDIRSADDAESVHLTAWPVGGDVDSEVLGHMGTVREVVSVTLEVRAKAGIKVRQPLGQLKVKGEALSEGYGQLIMDEVNVKDVVFDDSIENAVLLDTNITPELKAEGDVREFIRQIQSMRKDAGMEAHDRISMVVQSTVGGEELITAYKEDIQKTVGADILIFDTAEGTEVTAGEHAFVVSIEKK